MAEVSVTVRLKDIRESHDNFKYVSDQNLKGVKFNYVIARILVELQRHIDSLEESIKPSDLFKKFEQEKNQLLLKYSEKDDKGDVVFEDEQKTQVKIKDDEQEEFNEEFGKLIEEYDEVLKERDKQLKEFDRLIREEAVEIKVPELTLDDIPEDIDTKTMTSLVKLGIINH